MNNPHGHQNVELIASANREGAVFYHLWEHGELKSPAELVLARMINEHLRESVAPQLVFDESRQFREFIRPINLLGAMWYQMCRTFTGKQPVRRCPACGGWMIYERSTKIMHEKCANKVRQQRFRERQKANGETETRKQ